MRSKEKRFTGKCRTMKDDSNHFHEPVLRGIFFGSQDWRFDKSTPIFVFCVLRIAGVPFLLAYCVLRAYRLLPESIEVLHQPEEKGLERKRNRKE